MCPRSNVCGTRVSNARLPRAAGSEGSNLANKKRVRSGAARHRLPMNLNGSYENLLGLGTSSCLTYVLHFATEMNCTGAGIASVPGVIHSRFLNLPTCQGCTIRRCLLQVCVYGRSGVNVYSFRMLRSVTLIPTIIAFSKLGTIHHSHSPPLVARQSFSSKTLIILQKSVLIKRPLFIRDVASVKA